MSYIRCLSNPERLYIIHSEEGIEFWWNLGKPVDARCSYRDWCGLIKKIHKDGECFYKPYKSGELKLEEIGKGENIAKIKLTVGKKSLIMWEATWKYVYNSAIWYKDHLKRKFK